MKLLNVNELSRGSIDVLKSEPRTGCQSSISFCPPANKEKRSSMEHVDNVTEPESEQRIDASLVNAVGRC